MDDKALWRRVFDNAERAVTPRLEALVRSPEFAKTAALSMQARAAVRSGVTAVSARAWHALNLPAGTDVKRLRAQLGAMDRELRRLSLRLELARPEDEDTPADPDEVG